MPLKLVFPILHAQQSCRFFARLCFRFVTRRSLYLCIGVTRRAAGARGALTLIIVGNMTSWLGHPHACVTSGIAVQGSIACRSSCV